MTFKQLLSPPSLGNNFWQNKRLRAFIKNCCGTIVNIGTHEKNLGDSVIYGDIIKSKSVDVVLDIHHLPFKSESLEGMVITAILEHVSDPKNAIEECYRVLKRGGQAYASLPFLYPYHPDPKDFQRFTLEGARALFKQFHICLLVKTRGLGSMLGIILREFFSIIFSFHNLKIYKVLRYLLSWVLFPLKYLDHLTLKNSLESIAAPSFTVIAEKKSLE